MAKRMILMLGVAAVLLGALGFIKFKQVQSAVQASAFQPPPEAVTSIAAHREQWPATLSVIGTMEAVHGVTVSADLPGQVERIDFESGKSVQVGDVLVELDTRQERAQLASLEAQRDLARVSFDRAQQLVDEGVISRVEYDQATSNERPAKQMLPKSRRPLNGRRSERHFRNLGHPPGQFGAVSVGRPSHRFSPGVESNLCKLRRAAADTFPSGRWSRGARRQGRSTKCRVLRASHGCRFGCE